MTVIDGTSVKCWWTIPRPAAIASRGERKATGRPSMRISPASGWYSPSRMFISVLFPAPFSPRSAWISPVARSKSTWSLATTPGNGLTMPRSSTTGTGLATAVDPCSLTRVPVSSRRALRARARTLRRRARCAYAERRQLGGDALVPPVHAGLALGAGGTGRELVEVGLLELLAGGEQLLAGVVRQRPGEDVEAAEVAREHLGQRVLDLAEVRRRQVGDALARRLAVHEAEQAHGLGVGVEVLVARGVRPGLDLLRDPGVLRTPDPVRGGQAGVDLARGRVVVGDAPLALLLGDVGDGAGVGAGEHDLGARVEQRGGAVLLLDRVVPGVDEHDVHRALGAGLLDAAHDRVAEPELLRDRERGHVADLRVAVHLGARAGEHAGEVLEVLHRAEEVAEVLAVGLVAGQVQEGRVRELLGDRLHRVHVPEGGADDEVEALARERAEDLLGVGALGDVLDVRDVGVGRRSRTGTGGPRSGPGSSRRRRAVR